MSLKNNSTLPTIFYICNDFERALGLEKALPNYHIVCIDDNNALQNAKKNGVNIFCLEEELKELNPIYRNSNRLLQVKEVQQYIKNHTPQNEKSHVIFFKIAPNIEQTCKNLNYTILNTSSELNQMFELKLSQYQNLKDSNVNFPKTIIGKLNEVVFNEIVNKLGAPFVIQYDRGHTGSSTVFVEDIDQFNEELMKYPNRFAKFSQKIDGEAWTLNACVTRFGIVYGGLSYQITGIKECTSKAGGTVGNDWSPSRYIK
jgi:hypothetical protein